MKSLLVFAMSFMALNSMASNWKNQSELGATSISGNTETTTINALHSSIWEKEKNVVTGKGDYVYGEADDVVTARSWSASLRYDRKINDRWNWFLAQGVEGNKFSGFEERRNSDLGAKYYLIPQENKDDIDYLFFELGYRYTHEERIDNTDPDFEQDSSVGRAYIEYSKPVTESFKFKTNLEYLKTFDSDERNLYTFEIAGVNSLSEMLSLKVSYKLIKDDTLKDRGFTSDTDKTLTVLLVATY
ncbi:MAG: DUF481 domain-containing protein [Halobacteriovoraceae bacterium]|nr:DUF481 domain-containing protein [Halobacteriovoraceae bacterium]MCB9095673.1 DUF481 domain-containing protein [Halobacteriovoraceae bacterium]